MDFLTAHKVNLTMLDNYHDKVRKAAPLKPPRHHPNRLPPAKPPRVKTLLRACYLIESDDNFIPNLHEEGFDAYLLSLVVNRRGLVRRASPVSSTKLHAIGIGPHYDWSTYFDLNGGALYLVKYTDTYKRKGPCSHKDTGKGIVSKASLYVDRQGEVFYFDTVLLCTIANLAYKNGCQNKTYILNASAPLNLNFINQPCLHPSSKADCTQKSMRC